MKNQKIFVEKNGEICMNLGTLFDGLQDTIDCLILLNCQKEESLLYKFAICAQNIVIADGGANTFYKSHLRDSNKLRAIVGDLDSILPEVRSYYEQKGKNIIQVEDQDHNDFQKCLYFSKKEGYKTFVCLGAFGGRLDQTLSAFHIASKINRQEPDMHLILAGGNNLMVSLKPKITYRIQISDKIQRKGAIGLIPFGKATNIETSGFKWDFGVQTGLTEMQWSKFISTSNQLVSNQCSVRSDSQLNFVCSLKIENKQSVKI